MAYATGEAEVHPYDKKRLVLAGKTDTPNVAMTDAVGSLEAFHDLPSVLEDEHQWVPFAKTIRQRLSPSS